MLLILNSQLISQTTNTNLIKCFPQSQVNEIFKGLKQGEYLKIRVDKAEQTLVSADKIIEEQKSIIINKDKVIDIKDTLYKSLQYQNGLDMEIKNTKIDQLNETIKVNGEIYKSEKRKKFWSGIKYGAVGTIVISAVGILLLSK